MTPGVEQAQVEGFRAALRRLASTVAVVTAGDAAGAMGMTATAVSSISFDPPSLLVCVNRGARLHPVIARCGAFRVTWLRRGEEAIARAFSDAAASAAERFAVGGWGPRGCAPALSAPLAEAGCRLERAFDSGSHTIFIGVVTETAAGAGEPLVYYDGGYAEVVREPPPLALSRAAGASTPGAGASAAG